MQIEVARNGKVSNVSRLLVKNASLWVKLNGPSYAARGMFKIQSDTIDLLPGSRLGDGQILSEPIPGLSPDEAFLRVAGVAGNGWQSWVIEENSNPLNWLKP
jgi:hypothetical protein